MGDKLAALLALGLAFATATASEAPSVPRIDAPELARLGPSRVGVATKEFVDAARNGRSLKVDFWYPALTAADAAPETYVGRLTAEPPAPATEFTRAGIAVRGATPAAGRFPLVIVSHGYDNESVLFSWLGENLASKGYVVAAIRHADPPITDRARFPETILNRPLDIAFAAASPDWIPAMIASFAASHSFRSAWRMSYGMCVAQLWNQRTNGSERCARSHSTTPSSVSLVPATLASANPLNR